MRGSQSSPAIVVALSVGSGGPFLTAEWITTTRENARAFAARLVPTQGLPLDGSGAVWRGKFTRTLDLALGF